MPESLFLIKLQVCNFIKKATLTQLFSCELCEMSKNTLFTEHLRTTDSDSFNMFLLNVGMLHSIKSPNLAPDLKKGFNNPASFDQNSYARRSWQKRQT